MQTRVRFIESKGQLTVLEVESSPEHPISHSLPRTLGEIGLHIVQRETHMQAHLSVQRLQITELDGTGITEQRRLEVQSALVTSAGETPIPPRR